MPHAVVAHSSRYPRQTRIRPLFFLPPALFSTSIIGGLAVLATQLPVEALVLSLPFFG